MTLSFFDNPELVRAYDTALGELEKNPDSLDLKRQAVLSLARTGALEQAQSAFLRYGLDQVTDHEKTIALAGRLLKDLALEKSGSARAELATQSAARYAESYGVAGGLYPAINAASMSLVAGAPDEIIEDWCAKAEAALPASPYPDRTEAYYAEASRAEIALLRGNTTKARQMLHHAIRQDRLNYTGHATTLKQFRMILASRGRDTSWLKEFSPPKSAHYAGHIFRDDQLSDKGLAGLRAEISEAIQQQDIGFGFGALAAGADILFAETLLAEGAKLHVVLPTEIEAFLQTSVAPFGDSWSARFHDCLAGAASVHYVSDARNGREALSAGRFAADVAMGLAAIHAGWLNTETAQLLIWDEEEDPAPYSTAMSAKIWASRTGTAFTGQQQIIPASITRIRKDEGREVTGAAPAIHMTVLKDPDALPGDDIATLLARDHGAALVDQQASRLAARFADPLAAACVALDLTARFAERPALRIGLHMSVDVSAEAAGGNADTASEIASQVHPGTVWVNLPMAAHLSLHHPGQFRLEYLGSVTARGTTQTGPRVFMLREGTSSKKLL